MALGLAFCSSENLLPLNFGPSLFEHGETLGKLIRTMCPNERTPLGGAQILFAQTKRSKALPKTEFQYVVHQFSRNKDACMNIHLGLAPLVSLLAGILILIMPRLLNYIVALYLILIGLIGLFGAGNFRF